MPVVRYEMLMTSRRHKIDIWYVATCSSVDIPIKKKLPATIIVILA